MVKQDESANDPEMTPEEKERVKQLSAADIQLIDQTLLSNASHEWRKVARIVGVTMLAQENKMAGIPDVYYAQRIIYLVGHGFFESQGNLKRMRFSEVRLVNK
jgi:hypothetical protein